MSKAGEASTIGIVVGTLSAYQYIDLVDASIVAIENSGRRAVVLNVGKLNEAKLANFPEIDVFTIIACPESCILDSKDFYRPVVTLFEMYCALAGKQCLPTKYQFSHRLLLEYFKSRPSERDSEEAFFSLASGQLVSRNVVHHEHNQEDVRDKSLVCRQNATSIVQRSSIARTWDGLDTNQNEPVMKAAEGRKGVARSYQT